MTNKDTQGLNDYAAANLTLVSVPLNTGGLQILLINTWTCFSQSLTLPQAITSL